MDRNTTHPCFYEPRRDPTPFTRTCASRMAHRLRQTSTIFRQVEILLAHRRSKWTNSEAGNSNISIYYAFNVTLVNPKLTTICLFEQSELSSSAWHTKFHGISNIQTWMWSTLHSYSFYDKFYFMPINPFIHFPMEHRWSDRLFFRSSSYAFGFFRTASSPFTNLTTSTQYYAKYRCLPSLSRDIACKRVRCKV